MSFNEVTSVTKLDISKVIEDLELLAKTDPAQFFEEFVKQTYAIGHTGNGEALIRLSESIAIGNLLGEFARKSIAAAGYIVTHNPLKAHQLINEIEIEFRDSDMAETVIYTVALLRSIIAFEDGDFDECNKQLDIFDGAFKDDLNLIQGTDKIVALRIRASIALLEDDYSAMLLVQENLKELIKSTTESFVDSVINVNMVSKFLSGDYYGALRDAETVINNLNENWSMISMPVYEAFYVRACCYKEFLEVAESKRQFRELQSAALKNENMVWEFVSKIQLFYFSINDGNYESLVDELAQLRKSIPMTSNSTTLHHLLDDIEFRIQLFVGNLERSRFLVKRAITKYSRNALLAQYYFKNQKYVDDIFKNPITPKEQLFNLLSKLAKSEFGSKESNDYIRRAVDLAIEFGAIRTIVDLPPDVLSKILTVIDIQKSYPYERLAKLITEKLNFSISNKTAIAKLTQKELQLLRILATGKPLREASELLGISMNTGKTNLKLIYKKLGVNTKECAIAALNKYLS